MKSREPCPPKPGKGLATHEQPPFPIPAVRSSGFWLPAEILKESVPCLFYADIMREMSHFHNEWKHTAQSVLLKTPGIAKRVRQISAVREDAGQHRSCGEALPARTNAEDGAVQ